jgi:hypothetical protein
MSFEASDDELEVYDGFDGVKKGLKNKSIQKPSGFDRSFEIDEKKLNSVPSKDEISLE